MMRPRQYAVLWWVLLARWFYLLGRGMARGEMAWQIKRGRTLQLVATGTTEQFKRFRESDLPWQDAFLQCGARVWWWRPEPGPTDRWLVALWFAEWLGWWRYDGCTGMEPKRWPRARVKYNDGEISAVMAIGNAVDYAEIFGGEVVPP